MTQGLDAERQIAVARVKENLYNFFTFAFSKQLIDGCVQIVFAHKLKLMSAKLYYTTLFYLICHFFCYFNSNSIKI